MTEELTVDVPLVATGESPAVSLNNGTLLHPIESVRVRALPDHLPQSIEYSIESLVDFDTTIHVRDLVIPADVTLVTDGEEIIAKVQAPRVEEEPVVVGAAEVAEGEAAEAEAAEAAAGEGGAAESARADRPAPGDRRRQRDRRPVANTIRARIVICSGLSAISRVRSVASRSSRSVGLELGEQRFLVELGEEPDVAIDREPVRQAAFPGRDLREPGAAQLARRPIDRRDVAAPIVAFGRVELEVVEHLVEDRVGAEVADPLAVQPRHVGEQAVRAQDAPRLAQGARPVRDELEDERGHRRVEGTVGQRQAIGDGDHRAEPRALPVGQSPVGLRVGHRPHLRRGVDADDRDVRPALHGGQAELTGARPDVEQVPRTAEARPDVVEQLGDRRCQDGRPPAGVALRDPVVALALVGHPAIVPRPVRQDGLVRRHRPLSSPHDVRPSRPEP